MGRFVVWVMCPAILWALIISAVVLLCGCAMDTGWQVQFGAHPVTSIHDEETLRPQEMGKRGEFSTPAK